MYLGDPVLFENMLIRKMLELADIKSDDVFYDLGCGFAQNLIIAASEYGLNDCVGIEGNYQRSRQARRIVDRLGLSKKITIVNRNFQDVDLSDADIVFYGLSSDAELVYKFTNNLKRGCTLLHYAIWPIPGIIVDKIDYPFYRSNAPVTIAKSEKAWLASLIPRKSSTLELWREVAPTANSQYDVGFFRSNYTQHKRDLRRVLNKII